jgi:hypothetical protein
MCLLAQCRNLLIFTLKVVVLSVVMLNVVVVLSVVMMSVVMLNAVHPSSYLKLHSHWQRVQIKTHTSIIVDVTLHFSVK